MAGRPGRSGGANALSLDEHRIRGTFKPSRHAHLKPAPSPAMPMSEADRRRTLAGLRGEARRIVAELLAEYDGWDAALLYTLRAYGRSCARLEALQGSEPSPALYREIRANLALLSALNLERAR